MQRYKNRLGLWLGRSPSPRAFCLHNPALVPVESETDPFSARLSSPPQFLPCCPGHLCEGTVYPTSAHRVRLLGRGFAPPFPPLMSVFTANRLLGTVPVEGRYGKPYPETQPALPERPPPKVRINRILIICRQILKLIRVGISKPKLYPF